MKKLEELKNDGFTLAKVSQIFPPHLRGRARVGGYKAFTLAEVLITLVVIGVVVAITVPMFSTNGGMKVNSHRHANIVYKVTQATNLMKAHDELEKFASTDEFVDVLQKYLKISKRCSYNEIADCWPTKTVKISDGAGGVEEYDVSQATTRAHLGFDKDNDNGEVKNVGLILADGAHIILTYNPAFEGLAMGDELKASAKSLPVGDGIERISRIHN